MYFHLRTLFETNEHTSSTVSFLNVQGCHDESVLEIVFIGLLERQADHFYLKMMKTMNGFKK